METLQPIKQNDMVANNNNYKVSKNKHTTDEDENKQIHSQIRYVTCTLITLIKLKYTKKK